MSDRFVKVMIGVICLGLASLFWLADRPYGAIFWTAAGVFWLASTAVAALGWGSGGQRILMVFLNRPDQRLSGLEISELTGMATGAIYPHLARLEQQGWVLSDWDDTQRRSGRRRRVYWLNPNHPDRESVG